MQDDVKVQISHYLHQASEAQTTSDYSTAVAAARQAIALAQGAGLRELEARGTYEWSRALLFMGQLPEAYTQFEHALALARAAGSRQTEADALRGLGLTSNYQNLHAEAERHLMQALHIYREIGDRQGEGRTCNSLGENYHVRSDWERAMTYCEQAVSICREVGDVQGEHWSLSNLGEICRVQGDYLSARRYYKQSLAVERGLGDRRSTGISLGNLGMVAHSLGDNQTAWEYAQQVLPLAEAIGDRRLLAFGLDILGHALAGLSRWDEATTVYQRSLAIKNEISELNRAMEPLAGLARVALAQGYPARALEYVEEILAHLAFNGALDGADEPFRVHLTCYQVLEANAGPRAPDVLARAVELLQSQAARIPDAAIRRAFLEDVPYHRELMARYQQQQGAKGE